MATGFYSWAKSASAASNSNADSQINFAEGQAPSSLNDSNRMVMGKLADWRDDIGGKLTTTNTSTEYHVTTNQGFTALSDLSGRMLTIVMHTTCGAAPTLAVDGLTAQQIRTATGVNVGSGALVAGTPYQLIYFSATAEFILLNVTAPVFSGPVSITGTLAVSDTVTVTGSSVGFVGFEAISTEAAAAAGPILSLYRSSASPAASDVLGQLAFNGKDSGGNKTTYAYIAPTITDATDGSEDADIYLVTLIAGVATTVLRSSGAQIQVPGSLAVTGNITAANFSGGGRTTQYLTSGSSATYTRPSNPTPKTLVIKMVGGGGGGAAAQTNAGGTGGTTSFNSITAIGGSGGSATSAGKGAGGAGGTGGTGSASALLRLVGGGGCAGFTAGGIGFSGAGGPSAFGGGGPGVINDGAGQASGVNTGGGGSGGVAGGNGGGGGGGGGEYVEFYITSPSASYTYTVGSKGSGGSAGSQVGGDGGTGLIIVEEYY